MKKYSVALASLFALFAVPVMAAPFSVADLHTATKLAVEDMIKTKPEHAEHFYGYKSWLVDDESKVKVYVKHDGMVMAFDYNCHKHAHGTEIEFECHAQ